MDIRCPSNKLYLRIEEGLIEVKCNSPRCGAGNGNVVLHYFSLIPPYELVETAVFKSPESLFEKGTKK